MPHPTYCIGAAQTQIDPEAWVAPGAVVIGDVHLGAQASVWYHAVIRGDVERIRIGAQTNIQDGSVIHADAGAPCIIGTDVTVGHRSNIHGSIVGNGTHNGKGTITMNGSVIGEQCIIGAGSLITQGKTIPPRMLVIGSPARVIRALTPEEIALSRQSAAHYAHISSAYRTA